MDGIRGLARIDIGTRTSCQVVHVVPVVLTREQGCQRSRIAIGVHQRVVLHGHDEHRLITGSVKPALDPDVISAQNIHRHDLVQHQIVATSAGVVVGIILQRNSDRLVGKNNGPAGVRGRIEVRGGCRVGAGIGLPTVQRHRERGERRMTIHRHGRIDHDKCIVLRSYDVERGIGQVVVVGCVVVIVEWCVLMQRDVEFLAQAIRALQGHDVRVVGEADLVVAGDRCRGLDQ